MCFGSGLVDLRRKEQGKPKQVDRCRDVKTAVSGCEASGSLQVPHTLSATQMVQVAARGWPARCRTLPTLDLELHACLQFCDMHKLRDDLIEVPGCCITHTGFEPNVTVGFTLISHTPLARVSAAKWFVWFDGLMGG